MGFKSISIKLPTDYTQEQLRQKIAKELRIRDFTFQVENKSLDARQKSNIFWLVQVAVISPEIKGEEKPVIEILQIPFKKRKEQIVVTGSGPAGFFAAFVLQKAGFNVTLIERGSEVLKRGKSIQTFERTGTFDPQNNYAFGEGGAGTFSDGKLTSRSKHISVEKHFILSSYVEAGAPDEIMYMAHPHLGTDNLRKIVRNLRVQFENLGGKILFETMLENITIRNSKITEAITSQGSFPTDALFIAPGHSATETYKMLIRRGVPFRTKNFAIGSRMEHRQEIINQAQWGNVKLPGVKAAEYRLTSPADGKHPVFSFCMCPGGIVVPAAAYENTNIVNGMSFYSR
ncbi:MAG TPA: NAD(P)/FAD-dependent oxidoreductase, partial [Draconibacterium sp.]|nr:NAD(P)/FAD-dependent oxidoreductase [Draconibacterium sp.]